MTFADAKQRFSNRVADYVRYRPGYPVAVLDLLRAECALRPEHVVADIGSGTGFLSELFLKNKNRVFGVEPNEEMRRAGEEFLQEFKNFTSVNGSAESTTLKNSCVDFVTAGQAFHWFEQNAARREFSRILRPGGWVVIIWNDRRISETRFGRAYEELLLRYGIDYARVKEAYPDRDDMRVFFQSKNVSFRQLANAQTFDLAGLIGRLRSSSYAPPEGHANYAPMMSAANDLFHEHQENGQVKMDYVTHVYFGQLPPTES
jgi:SAM-dependent methyltransferase